MTVDWTISISDLIAALSAIGSTWAAVFVLWHRIDRRLGSAEQTLAERVLPTLEEHAAAMKRHDAKISDAMTQFSTMMGRLDPMPWLPSRTRKP